MISERAAGAVGGVLVPAGLSSVMLGSRPAPTLTVLLVGAGAVALSRRRGAAVPDAWDMATEAPARTADPARGSVAAALGPVEARELALSPWFVAGVGFCVIFTIAITSFSVSWWGAAGLLPILVHPLCGLTIVGVHRGVTRARRDGAEELFDSCPATIDQRAAGHMLAGVVPVLAATTFVAVVMVGASIFLPDIYGPIDGRVLSDIVLATVLLPVGAVALGVATGRRAPWVIAPLVALGVVLLVNVLLIENTDQTPWLMTGRPTYQSDAIYFAQPSVARLAWIGGLVVIVAALATSSPRRSARGRLALGLGGVLAVTGLVATIRDVPDSTVDQIVAYVRSDPSAAVCHDLSATIDLCVPDPYRDHGGRLAGELVAVVDAQPAASTASFRLRFLPTELDELPDPVRARLDGGDIPFDVVPLPFGHHDGDLAVARFKTAAAIVGVTVSPFAPENTLVDGQARGVVLLWLATRGLDDDDVARLLRPYDSSDATMAGHLWPGVCGADIQWAPEDVAAARLLHAQDPERVGAVLEDDWSRWIDPSTPTDALLRALGLPAQAPTSPIRPLGSPC